MNNHVGKDALNGKMPLMALAVILLAALIGLAGCSGGSGSNKSVSETINGHSVAEYNSDIDYLDKLLKEAQNLDHQIEAMGNPNSFTSQSQVDQYNALVDKYNAASDAYNSAARSFSNKYGSTIDGAGTMPTDPDNIDLPSKR